jgi:putative phage-type endonuclease
MIKKYKTAGLSESEWQALRLKFVRESMVGGSDASTLLGLNQYKSEINMFYQAIGLVETPNKMNGAMLHGKQLEDYVAKCWQYWDGTEEGWVANTLSNRKIKRYRKIKNILVNTKYPYLFANVDGKIIEHPDKGKTPGILEIKTISGYSADMWEGGIPPSYYVQLQHYLLVTGYTWGEIMYLKDGRELGCITFEEDKEFQERIATRAASYNARVLQAMSELGRYPDMTQDERMQLVTQYEPDADQTKAFDAFISEKHKKRQEDVSVYATDDVHQYAKSYSALQDAIKQLEADKQLEQNRIKQYMEQNGATIMVMPENGKVTWRTKFTVKL